MMTAMRILADAAAAAAAPVAAALIADAAAPTAAAAVVAPAAALAPPAAAAPLARAQLLAFLRARLHVHLFPLAVDLAAEAAAAPLLCQNHLLKRPRPSPPRAVTDLAQQRALQTTICA